jgi:putative addiction module killer protein
MYPNEYNTVMNVFEKSDEFDDWFARLKDHVGKAQIALRLDRAVRGNFGDCEPVGSGVSEMRIHYGPGYPVYFMQRGAMLYLLLLGGDKSTQKRDIKRAIAMTNTLPEV